MPRVALPPKPESRRNMSLPSREDSSGVLNSWKEIADFMGRTVRTVQRWEHTLNLPVQRPRGDRKNVVFARTDELRRWMEGRGVSDPQRVNLTRSNLARMHQLCLMMMKQTETLRKRATILSDELRSIQRRRNNNGNSSRDS